MSNIWHTADGSSWQSIAVPANEPVPGERINAPGIRLVRFNRGTDKGVALLTSGGVRVLVNGRPVLGGFRLLEHRDEIVVGRRRLYFSAESSPTVTVFRQEPGARACTCPVCRGPIKDGMTAVQCPGCSRWFHQLEPAEGQPARRCWTFSPNCRICNHPTALGGEAVWTPLKEEANA